LPLGLWAYLMAGARFFFSGVGCFVDMRAGFKRFGVSTDRQGCAELRVVGFVDASFVRRHVGLERFDVYLCGCYAQACGF